MSSFQGVGIERCPHFKGLEYREVSSFQGVGMERCPHFKGLE